MRRITDEDGRDWDVVLGRESFGALLALFIPAAGNPAGPRQAHLEADGYAAARTALDGMDRTDLLKLLDGSNPKDE